jgi:hypothetical protein
MIEKFDLPTVLSRLRNAFSAVACDVYIAKYSKGEIEFSPWETFLANFESLGINEKGSPSWKNEPITHEVDFETIQFGYNCSGEIKLVAVNNDVLVFIDTNLRNENIALLLVPKDAEQGELALLIRNIKLFSSDEGTANDENAETVLTLKFKTRVSRLNDLYSFVEIGSEPIPSPLISTSKTILTGFEYDEGNGASESQSVKISGSNLQGDLIVTPSSNYEISLDNNSYYSSETTLAQLAGTVEETTLFVRLKAGVAAGDYNESITISSMNARSAIIDCSGSVIALSPLTDVGYLRNGNFIQGANFWENNGTANDLAKISNGVIQHSPSGFKIQQTLESPILSGAEIEFSFDVFDYAASGLYCQCEWAGEDEVFYGMANGWINGAGSFKFVKTASMDIKYIKIQFNYNGTASYSNFQIIDKPVVSSSDSDLTGFGYDEGSEISPNQSVKISGSNLQGSLVVSVNGNYEISTDNVSFQSSELTFSPLNGTVAETSVYVRLKTGLLSGNYDGTITISSINASNVSVGCSGVVTILVPNYFINGDFENGSAGWSSGYPPYPQPVPAGMIENGTYHHTTDTKLGQILQTPIPAGKTLKVSFEVSECLIGNDFSIGLYGFNENNASLIGIASQKVLIESTGTYEVVSDVLTESLEGMIFRIMYEGDIKLENIVLWDEV